LSIPIFIRISEKFLRILYTPKFQSAQDTTHKTQDHTSIRLLTTTNDRPQW